MLLNVTLSLFIVARQLNSHVPVNVKCQSAGQRCGRVGARCGQPRDEAALWPVMEPLGQPVRVRVFLQAHGLLRGVPSLAN